MRPLALLVLATLLVIALLVAWWFGGGPAAADARRAAPAPEPAAPMAVAGAPPRTTTPEPLERQPAEGGTAGERTSVLVKGTVRDPEGAGVGKAWVGLRRHGQIRNVSTAGNGTWSVTNLQPGQWQLLCSAEGFARYEAEITLDQRAVQQFDIELRSAYVVKVKIQNAAGEFLPDLVATRISAAELSVVATAEPVLRDLPVTEDAGYIAFGAGEWSTNSGRGRRQDGQLRKDGFAGVLRLDREPPVHAALVLRHVVLQRQRIEQGQRELTFTLELAEVLERTGSVTLRLVDDAMGEPLPGARMLVGCAQAVELGQRTDADGRLTIDGQPPGLLRVEVWYQDYETLHRSVLLPPGGKLDLELRLSRAITITAATVAADGKPVTGVDLAWTCLDDRAFPQPLVEDIRFPVDREGRCKIALGRHRYVVIARSDRRYGYAAVDLRGGAPVPLTIPVVEPVGVDFRMRADATVGFLVTISDLSGVPARALWLGGEHRPPGTSLPPGSYRVEIDDGDGRLVRSCALAVASEPVTIDVPSAAVQLR